MKKRIKSFLIFSNEDILMIVLACLSFSGGIWSNYRQLWRENIGLNVGEIARILSVSLICSAVISFLISILSNKVRIKDVVMISILFRAVSFIYLFVLKSIFWIKVFILLGVMSEVIFSISIWPLIATVNKSDKAYRKHVLVNYISKDVAVVACAFLLGVSIGNYVFDLNGSMFFALVTSLIGALFLMFFKNNKNEKKDKRFESIGFKTSIKKLFSSLTSKFYLIIQFVSNVSYGMLFGLMMLILTNYIEFDISFASIFIIVSNLLGSLFTSLLCKVSDKISVKLSVFLKYGLRALIMILAVISNNLYVYIISIVVMYITSRILDDKVNGTYLNRIDTENMFLFGNLRYFLVSLGDGFGVFVAGIMLNNSLKFLFVGAVFILILQIILMFWLDNVRIKEDKLKS